MELLDARRDEVAYYDTNIATCHAMLAMLPSVWPEHLEPLRTNPDRHAAAATIDDLADVELFAKLALRDDTAARLRAETFERTKAAAILDHMESQP